MCYKHIILGASRLRKKNLFRLEFVFLCWSSIIAHSVHTLVVVYKQNKKKWTLCIVGPSFIAQHFFLLLLLWAYHLFKINMVMLLLLPLTVSR